MTTRKEATEFINNQLFNWDSLKEKKDKWHYGSLELRNLLDYIYGYIPKDREEFIRSSRREYYNSFED